MQSPRKQNYVYFVSFVYGNTFGNAEVTTDGEVTTMDGVRSMRDVVVRGFGVVAGSIVVLNFQLLRVEEAR